MLYDKILIIQESTKLMKKASESQFNELHSLVTEDFLKRIKSGEATTQDCMDAAHYKGSKTKGRLQTASTNRKSRLKIRRA